MTREEAARILKADDVEWNEIFDSESGLLDEALDMAIRSLEAWELAKAEILKAQTYKMFVGDTELYIERKDVLKIIDKHLKEVENG